jgi:hypothetical protein
MAYEQQKCSGRRFLERLEQRVGRGRIHRFGRRDQRHLGALAVRRQLAEGDQLAHALDADGIDRRRVALVVVGHGLDELQVRMCSLTHVTATRTDAAGLAVFERRLAQQGAREVQREQAFAEPAPACDQERVRPAIAPRERSRRSGDLPGR